MPKKTELDFIEFAETLVHAAADPEQLALVADESISYRCEQYLQLKGERLFPKETPLFERQKTPHQTARQWIDRVINPLSKELPAAYDAGVDWLESKIDLLGKENKGYWENRVKVLKKNSNSPKVV